MVGEVALRINILSLEPNKDERDSFCELTRLPFEHECVQKRCADPEIVKEQRETKALRRMAKHILG